MRFNKIARVVISPFAASLLSLCFVSLTAHAQDAAEFEPKFANPDAELPLSVDANNPSEVYDHIDPQGIVPSKLKAAALAYWHAHQSEFDNKKIISIVDFSKNSADARFYIIHVGTGAVWAIHTAHGKGSDPKWTGNATSFSNTPGSDKSSLGVYRAAESYNGKHGLSLRLDGLSSTNSNARDRAIVIHAAAYVYDSNTKAGRSDGCLAVSTKNHSTVVNLLKGGSMIYAGRSAD